MTNLLNKVKEVIKNHKKIAISVLVLLLVSAISVGYILTNKNTSVNTNSEKTVETSTKKDETKKSDEKKNEVKADKKNEDKKQEEKKEEATSETKTEETTTSTTSNTPAVENNSVSNSNYTTNNSTSSQPTSTPCVPTYTTVNHEATGHYETQIISEAWDEPVYARKIVGGHTGRVYNSLDEFDNQDEDGNYSVKDVQVDTIHHDAVTQQVWVVDQPAWTETVASGC